MEDAKKQRLIAIILVILVIVVVCINLFKSNESKIDTSIKLLEDRNRFFEVSNSVDKFIKYVAVKDTDSILKIVNNEYLKDYNIPKESILSIVPDISGNYVFSATSIYQQQLNETIYKYYVKGYYYQETIDGVGQKFDYYVIVYFYTESMTFSIEPYDGKVFEGDL